MLRRHRAGGDVILDVLRQAAEHELIAAREAADRRMHRDLFPFRRALVARIEFHGGGLQTDRQSRNHFVRMSANRGVARCHTKIVKGGFIVMRASPQQRGSIAEEAGARRDHPHEKCARANTGAKRNPEALLADHLFRLRAASYA